MNQQGQLRVHITGKDCWAHEWSHNQVATSFDLPPNTIRKCKNPSTKKNRNLDECAVNHESFPPFPRNYFFLSGGMFIIHDHLRSPVGWLEGPPSFRTWSSRPDSTVVTSFSSRPVVPRTWGNSQTSKVFQQPKKWLGGSNVLNAYEHVEISWDI